eukprot:PhM_4_TR8086/c0_g1_i1/m.6039
MNSPSSSSSRTPLPSRPRTASSTPRRPATATTAQQQHRSSSKRVDVMNSINHSKEMHLQKLSCRGWDYTNFIYPGLQLFRALIPLPADLRDGGDNGLASFGATKKTVTRSNVQTVSLLRVRVPPTMLWGLDITTHPVCFHTNKDGCLVRTDYPTPTFYQSLLKLKPHGEHPGVVLKRVHVDDNTYCTETVPMSLTHTHTAVAGGQTAAAVMGASNAAGHCSAMQKYVWSRGTSASIVRVVWSPTHPPHAFVLANRTRFADESEKHGVHRYLVTTDNPIQQMEIMPMRSAQALEEMSLMLHELTHFMASSARPAVVVNECIADFIRDKDTGRAWLIQLKGFRHTPVPIVEPKARHTIKTLACGMCLKRCPYPDLKYVLTLKMMQHTEEHLSRHGITMDWFRFSRNPAEVLNDNHDQRKVCQACHDLHLHHQRQQEAEASLALGVGVSVLPESTKKVTVDEIKQRNTVSVATPWKDASRQGSDVKNNRTAPPPTLLVYRLIISFHLLHHLPARLVGSEMTVALHFPGRKNAMHVVLNTDEKNVYLENNCNNNSSNNNNNSSHAQGEEGGDSVAVPCRAIRVFHMYSEETNVALGERPTIARFFEKFTYLDIELHAPTWVVKSQLPLGPLHGGDVSRADVIAIFNGAKVSMLTLQASLGLQLCTERAAASDAEDLPRLAKGVFLPPEHFYAVESLPDEVHSIAMRQGTRLHREAQHHTINNTTEASSPSAAIQRKQAAAKARKQRNQSSRLHQSQCPTSRSARLLDRMLGRGDPAVPPASTGFAKPTPRPPTQNAFDPTEKSALHFSKSARALRRLVGDAAACAMTPRPGVDSVDEEIKGDSATGSPPVSSRENAGDPGDFLANTNNKTMTVHHSSSRKGFADTLSSSTNTYGAAACTLRKLLGETAERKSTSKLVADHRNRLHQLSAAEVQLEQQQTHVYNLGPEPPSSEVFRANTRAIAENFIGYRRGPPTPPPGVEMPDTLSAGDDIIIRSASSGTMFSDPLGNTVTSTSGLLASTGNINPSNSRASLSRGSVVRTRVVDFGDVSNMQHTDEPKRHYSDRLLIESRHNSAKAGALAIPGHVEALMRNADSELAAMRVIDGDGDNSGDRAEGRLTVGGRHVDHPEDTPVLMQRRDFTGVVFPLGDTAAAKGHTRTLLSTRRGSLPNMERWVVASRRQGIPVLPTMRYIIWHVKMYLSTIHNFPSAYDETWDVSVNLMRDVREYQTTKMLNKGPLMLDVSTEFFIFTPDITELQQYLRNPGTMSVTIASAVDGDGMHKCEVPIHNLTPNAGDLKIMATDDFYVFKPVVTSLRDYRPSMSAMDDDGDDSPRAPLDTTTRTEDTTEDMKEYLAQCADASRRYLKHDNLVLDDDEEDDEIDGHASDDDNLDRQNNNNRNNVDHLYDDLLGSRARTPSPQRSRQGSAAVTPSLDLMIESRRMPPCIGVAMSMQRVTAEPGEFRVVHTLHPDVDIWVLRRRGRVDAADDVDADDYDEGVVKYTKGVAASPKTTDDDVGNRSKISTDDPSLDSSVHFL